MRFLFLNYSFRQKKSRPNWNEIFPFCRSLRYIAVTQPIKYAKHKNSRRVCLTILLVWAISAAIGSPIVLGLNNTPDRLPDLCLFYNSDFIVYSSLSSFYIPCIIMVFLYWNIFKVSLLSLCLLNIMAFVEPFPLQVKTWKMFPLISLSLAPSNSNLICLNYVQFMRENCSR